METSPPLPPQQQAPQPPLPPQEGMGCFAKGCLVVVIAGILLIGVVCAGAWYFYGKTVTVFTSPRPADVRIGQVADVDLRNAEQKLNRLGQATTNNEETTIEFTAAELNALIAREPLLAEMKDRTRVSIADSMMTVEMSVPLDVAPLPKLKGRWLNGTARLGFSFVLGQFAFDPKSVEANGHVFPEEVLAAFTPSFNRSFNDGFQRGVEKKDQAANIWRHLKTIGLDRDKLVVVTQRL
jgi:hypothetical protein